VHWFHCKTCVVRQGTQCTSEWFQVRKEICYVSVTVMASCALDALFQLLFHWVGGPVLGTSHLSLPFHLILFPNVDLYGAALVGSLASNSTGGKHWPRRQKDICPWLLSHSLWLAGAESLPSLRHCWLPCNGLCVSLSCSNHVLLCSFSLSLSLSISPSPSLSVLGFGLRAHACKAGALLMTPALLALVIFQIVSHGFCPG
jgi:hypothetical protein